MQGNDTVRIKFETRHSLAVGGERMVERKSGQEGLTGGCCMVQLEMMGFGLAWSNSDGKVCSESVQRWGWPGFLVDGMQGGLQWKWNQTPPCAWHVQGVRPAYIPFSISLPSRVGTGSWAHLFSLCCFAELVHKLAHGHQHRQDQAGSQDDEDAPDLLDTQGAGLLVFLLGTPAAPPPLLLHDVQLVLLLQLQNGDGHLVPVRGA